MWNMLLEPNVYWPLLIDLIFGFAISAFTRGVRWRFLVWFFIPLIIGSVYAAPHIFSLWGKSSEGTGSWMTAGIVLFVQGLIVCGICILLGYFVCRKRTVK
jgi:hypothetical protein